LVGLGGLVVLLALHWFLHRRGFAIWTFPPQGQHGGDAALRLPTLRNSWWVLLATLILMVAGIALAAATFGGG
jgi:hypothetical protein